LKPRYADWSLMGRGLCIQKQGTCLFTFSDEFGDAPCFRQYRPSGGFPAEFQEKSMFFALAIPAILDAVIPVVVTAIATRAASDIYDKVTSKNDE
jgi:hypothetical protein